MSVVQDYPLAAEGQPVSPRPFASGSGHKLIVTL